MSAVVRSLFGRRARLRWIHLILGGALAMPYVLVGSVVIGPVTGSADVFGSFPPPTRLVRRGPAARGRHLAVPADPAAGVGGGALAVRGGHGPARPRARAHTGEKGRTAAWFTLHLGFGGIIAGMSLALPPFAATLIVLPVLSGCSAAGSGCPKSSTTPGCWRSPGRGAVGLVALAGCAACCGALLARWAPLLLGPTPRERLAAAEARAADLAVRNRLARELHDSVGHALSAVTLQASAARRVLDSDPEFVREALAAIEDTTRRTVGELDAVLGVLREGDAPARPRRRPSPPTSTGCCGVPGRAGSE